jgi:very-short-patch-repair endonuclease
MKDMIEHAYADAAADFELGLRGRCEIYIPLMTGKPESKIEEALLIAFLSLDAQLMCFHFDMVEQDREIHYFDMLRDARPWVAKVTGQAKVLKYRADFLVEVMRKEEVVGKIVVECDGHDFHERTAYQAERDRSRDREMAAAGYVVFRFTGREIYRSPTSCAIDVLKLVMDMAKKTGPL